jgi:hypothetical protein
MIAFVELHPRTEFLFELASTPLKFQQTVHSS